MKTFWLFVGGFKTITINAEDRDSAHRQALVFMAKDYGWKIRLNDYKLIEVA